MTEPVAPEAQSQEVIAPAQEAEQQPAIPWETALEAVDKYLREEPERRQELRSHSIVAGLAGEMAQRLASAQIASQQEEARLAAERAKEEELLRLADEDPDAFAEKFRTEKQAERARKEIETLRYNERKTLAENLGRAVNDLPEMAEATQDELAEIAGAVAGVPDDQVIAAWHKAVVKMVAKRQAGKLAAAEISERLKAERAAWEAEQQGAALKTGAAPNLRAGTGQASLEAPDWRDPAFNQWYEENVLHQRRTPVA